MFSRPKNDTTSKKEHKDCSMEVTLNGVADVKDVLGYGMKYLASCPLCVYVSMNQEDRRHNKADCPHCQSMQPGDRPAWSGEGEAYFNDHLTAVRHAEEHNRYNRGRPRHGK